MFLDENTITGQIIYLDIGSDGVCVAESSSSCLWPILVNSFGFYGKLLSESADNFLRPFVEEFVKLHDDFTYKGKNIYIRYSHVGM